MQKSLPLCGMRDDASLPMLFRQIREGLHRQLERQVETGRIGISYSQCLVVKILAGNGPQMPGDLARFLHHNAGAMTRLIDRLEEKGFVRRKPNADDRRALTIELTPSGRALSRTIGKYMEHAQELALRGVKTAERTKLFELLRRMRDALDETP